MQGGIHPGGATPWQRIIAIRRAGASGQRIATAPGVGDTRLPSAATFGKQCRCYSRPMSVVLISSEATESTELISTIEAHAHRTISVSSAFELATRLKALPGSVTAYICLRGVSKNVAVLELLHAEKRRTGVPVIVVADRDARDAGHVADFVFAEPLNVERLLSVLRSLARLAQS